MRKESRKRGLSDFRVVYSPERAQEVLVPKDAEGKAAQLGTMSYIPPIMGQLIASDVILYLTGLNQSEENRA